MELEASAAALTALTQHYRSIEADVCKPWIPDVTVKPYTRWFGELARLGRKMLIFRLARVEPGGGQATYQIERRAYKNLEARRGEDQGGLMVA